MVATTVWQFISTPTEGLWCTAILGGLLTACMRLLPLLAGDMLLLLPLLVGVTLLLLPQAGVTVATVMAVAKTVP